MIILELGRGDEVSLHKIPLYHHAMAVGCDLSPLRAKSNMFIVLDIAGYETLSHDR